MKTIIKFFSGLFNKNFYMVKSPPGDQTKPFRKKTEKIDGRLKPTRP